MTLQYLEITQQDLQREYHLARTQPRHLAPAPRAVSSASPPSADLLSQLDSLRTTQHVLEMFRRSVAETPVAAFSTASLTGSSRLSPKPRSSTHPKNRQRLAG